MLLFQQIYMQLETFQSR